MGRHGVFWRCEGQFGCGARNAVSRRGSPRLRARRQRHLAPVLFRRRRGRGVWRRGGAAGAGAGS
eukprot:11211497-Lingulodinium_polyedra.AAC.1